ncbi:MAG: SH3 domain-containing protein [Clostridium sp.]|jgi:uncharacterized protein YgiM (DUF1202 family)|nr:SH3 domain-containing protein [Clostridium sp.]
MDKKQCGKIPVGRKLFVALILTVSLGLFGNSFVLDSYAQGQGKVKQTANVRQEPTTSSPVIASALQDREITINGKVTGADGKLWYQIFKDSETLGYVRSDFIEVISGDIPEISSTGSASGGGTSSGAMEEEPGGGTGNMGTPSQVVTVLPVDAAVNQDNARIRAEASDSAELVTTLANGVSLTVNGKAADPEGHEWYWVSFTAQDGSAQTGYIRSDYAALSGELVEGTEEPGGAEEEPEPAQIQKAYDTELRGEDWYLLDHENSAGYSIAEVMEALQKNPELILAYQKKLQTQQLIVICLVILACLCVFAVTFLLLKIKDMTDAGASPGGKGRPVPGSRGVPAGGARARAGGSLPKNVIHTIKDGETAAAARPPVRRPVRGTSSSEPDASSARKPPGERRPGTERESGGDRHPAAEKDSGVEKVPVAQRRLRSSAVPNAVKPSGGAGRGPEKPERTAPNARPSGGSSSQTQSPGWKSRNFMSDDDDDDFEFDWLS